MKKGAAVSIVVIFGGVCSMFMSWNTWLSFRSISQGESLSSIVESNMNVASALEAYQSKNDAITAKMAEDIVKLRIDTGTTNEIIKLLGDRQGINSQVVETRITKEVASDASTTKK